MSAPSNPGWKAGSPALSASNAHRWPPADPPLTATKEGSPPYSAMCSFTQATARFASTMWSGHVAFGLSR